MKRFIANTSRRFDTATHLRSGTTRANEVAEQTLWLAKQAAKYDFFSRSISLK